MADRINFQVGYTVDKTGLSEMQSLFQQIANMAKEPGNQLNTGLQKAAVTANTLDGILEKTFNTNLGTLNVTKFNQELSKSGLTLKSVQADLSSIGNQGATAYNRLAQAILGTNLQLKESNKLLDSMATTMANTVKWGITSSIFNNITNSVQKAYTYTKQLNTSLNDIRIVTDKSADSMSKFAVEANNAAKELGANTLDYTNASLIYYQQGLSDAEVAARAETTIKAANVTGQTGDEVSEQLTAVWNGYKVTAEETEAYVDKLAAVAATTAADLEELSVGMSKVASAANAMGVDFDDLNAQIATIVSVTRQAPESVGTALKTIYARLGDLKVDGVDEFGVKLGEVSSQMQTMGIQILDQEGNLRDMSSVIAEVAQKWGTWTEAQRQAAAVAMAGKRQYNNLIALFDNWDMYTDALNTSVDALGTLQEQQDIYMESTAAKLKTLKATWQDLYGDLLDEDELNTGIEGLTNLVQVFDNFIESFGGGLKSITAFGTIVANIFNKQIANAINGAIQNQQKYQNNIDLLQSKLQVMQQGVAGGLATGNTAVDQGVAAGLEKEIALAKEIYDIRVGLNSEEYNLLTNYQQQIGLLEAQITEETILAGREAERLVKSGQFSEEFKNNVELIKNGTSAADLYDSKFGEILDKNDKIKTALIEQTQQLKKVGNDANEISNIAVKIRDSVVKNEIVYNKLSASEHLRLSSLMDEEEIEKDITQSRKDLEQIIKRINSLMKEQTSQVEQEYKIAEKVEQEYRKINEERSKQRGLEYNFNSAKEAAESSRDITQSVVTTTAALGTMAMAWSSVNSLIQTWNDENASFGDRITQTFITLGMTIPMVISSFNKLKEVFNISKISLSSLTASMKAQEAANKALIATNKARAAQEEASIALEEVKRKTLIKNRADELVSRKLNIAAMEEEAAIEKIKNTFKTQSIYLSNNEAKAIYKEIMAREANTIALKEEAAAQTAANTAMLANPIGLVIAGLVALTAAIAGVVTIYNKYNEKQLENAKNAVEEAKARQSEINANKDLYKSYEETLTAYKKGDSSRDELNSAIEKVCDAYDIEINKLDLLAEKYDNVTKKIKEKRNADLEESKSLMSGAKGSQEIATFQTARKGRGRKTIFGDQYEVDFLSKNPFSLIDENLATALNLSISDDFKSSQSKFAFQFDYGNMDQMLQFYDEAIIAKEQYINLTTSEQRANSEDFTILNEWLERIKPEVENYRQIINDLNNTELELKFNQEDFSNLSTIEFYKKINSIKSELKDISTETLNDFINNYFSNNKDIEIQNIKINIAEDISKKTNEEIENIISKIDNFNASELSYLQLHLNTTNLSKDLDAWIQEHAQILSYSQQVDTNNKLKNVITNYDDKKGFQQEDLDTLFAQPNTSEILGLTAVDFNTLDYGDQLQALTTAWIENTNQIIKNRDTLKSSLEEEISNANKAIEAYANRNQNAINSFNILINGHNELINKQNDLKDAFQELASTGISDVNEAIKKLKPETQALLNLFTKTTGSSLEVAKGLGHVFNKSEQLQSELEVVTAEYENIIHTEKNAEEVLKALNKVTSAQNAILDDIQSAYKSLTSIVDNYNETGAWTIDNVQQLMSMEDAYVATLQFENGQLSLNESAFQALTIAKIDDMEQTAVLTAQEELEKLAEEGVTNASLSATSAILNAAAAARDASAAAKEGAAAWDEYAASMRAAAGVSGTQYDAKAKEITDALQNRLKAAESAKNQIRKGGTSMRQAMGGSTSKGSSGGKEKQEKDQKEYKDEFDRYWELKKAIDAVDKAISKLDKDQENLYGYELIRSLKQENQLLEQQAANYEKLAAAQQAEAAELRAQLGTMGVMFDASGAITNYAAATTQALAEYNAAIQQYNAGLIDETTLGVYEKAYENFKKLLERYDTLFYNELKDTEEKLDEIRRKELANNLKAWEVEIDLKLNFKELKRGWNNFFKEVKEDFKKVFKDLTVEINNLRKNAKTYLKENGTIAIDIQAVKDVTREIDKMRKGGSSDMFESISQAQEKLKELNEQLQDHAKELHDLWKEAWDAYLEGIDQVGDKFDDLMDRFEKINEELDFQRELIQLIYGDEAYKLMDSLYKGQEKSLENQLQSVKQQVDMWKQLFAESGAAMDNQEDWDEDQQKYYEQWQEAQSKLNDLTLDYIKLLKEDYLNTIDDVLKQLDKALTGSTLEDTKTQWERISNYSGKYLDDVEKAYETQKLANKIDESIASTSNLKNQQKLQALRDKEIGYLREKEHLTQYDLDAAEARYQIALKEMALEDARNNKTSMKLVRNEQGNWSYQYLADEEEVANKQQELLDAYNNLYQLASDAYESNLESLQELQEQYLESAREIYASETLSEEEKEQKLLELRNWYFEQYALLAEENTLYRNDLATSASALLLEIYEQDQEAYNAMTDAEKALLDDLLAAHIDGYMDLEEKIKENYKNIDDASRELMADTRLDWTSSAQLLADLWNKDKGGSVRYEVLDAHKQIQKATENYKSKIDWLADAVERNFGESGIRGAIDKAADATENLKDKTEELVDDGVRYIESLKSVVEELEDAWKSVQDAIEDAINLIEEYLKYVGEANAAAASTGNVGGGSSATVSTPSGKNGGSGSGGSGNGGKSFNPTESQQYDTGRYYYLDGAYDEKGNRINQQDLTLNEAKRLQEVLKSKKGNPGTIKHYATGGYTGEWSDNNGRLAVLHQKELVLNQDDTSNFLEGINIIRDLSNLNGSINNAIMRSIMNMASAVSGLKPGNINTTNANETNESNNNIFNINAEFPNANNVEEIKEALMSLPNLASQYVARG